MLKKLKAILPPILSACLFSFLACLNLKTAIWFDEAYSAFLIRGNFQEIWTSTAVDVHPPLYYFCLKIWSLVFGTSDFALRSMSVFFAALGIILAFFLLRRLFGSRPATISTFLLSLSPLLIRYAEEMRMYGIVFFLIISATLVLDYALKSKRKSFWFLYAVLISLGMWTHYFTALAWIAHLAWIVYYLRKTKELKTMLKTLVLSYSLAVVLFLPWLPSFFSQVRTVQNGFWIPEVSLSTPLSFFSESLTLKSPDELTSWLLLPVFGVLVLSLFFLKKVYKALPREKKFNFLFLSTLIFLPPLLLILLSLPPLKSTYVTRYITYSSALLASLLGLIFAFSLSLNLKKKEKILPALFLVVLLACSGIGIHAALTRENNSEVRELMSLISPNKEGKTEPVLVSVEPMDYYNFFFYETPENPVYSFNVDFIWSSLDPLKNLKTSENRKFYVENFNAEFKNVENFYVILSKDKVEDSAIETFLPDEYSSTETIATDNFVLYFFSLL